MDIQPQSSPPGTSTTRPQDSESISSPNIQPNPQVRSTDYAPAAEIYVGVGGVNDSHINEQPTFEARQTSLLQHQVTSRGAEVTPTTDTPLPASATPTSWENTPPFCDLSHGASGEHGSTTGAAWGSRQPLPVAKPPSYEESVQYPATHVHLTEVTRSDPPPMYKRQAGHGDLQSSVMTSHTTVSQTHPQAAVLVSQSNFNQCHSLDNLLRMEEHEPLARRQARAGSSSVWESDLTAVLAFMGCLLCWPVGLLAVYYSYVSRVYKHAGNLVQARAFAKSALVCAVGAIMLGGMSLFAMYFYKRKYPSMHGPAHGLALNH